MVGVFAIVSLRTIECLAAGCYPVSACLAAELHLLYKNRLAHTCRGREKRLIETAECQRCESEGMPRFYLFYFISGGKSSAGQSNHFTGYGPLL